MVDDGPLEVGVHRQPEVAEDPHEIPYSLIFPRGGHVNSMVFDVRGTENIKHQARPRRLRAQNSSSGKKVTQFVCMDAPSAMMVAPLT